MIIARVLAALVLAIGLSAVPLSIARACSCMDPGGPAQIIEAAELAFIGTVVNAEEVGDGPFGPGAPMVRYAFDVERASAPISSDVVHVEALDDGGGASCGFTFGVGERWFVSAAAAPGDAALTTWLCNGNIRMDQLGADGADEVLALLPVEPIASPAGSESGFDVPGPVVTGGLGVLALIGVSFIAFRRDRRDPPAVN